VTTNPYDQGSRYLARQDEPGVFAFLLNLPAEAFAFERWLDVRGVAFPGDPERTCDLVAFLRDQRAGGVPWAIILEFQAEADSKMFGRLLVYKGLIWLGLKASEEKGDRFAVGALVVNLTKVGNSDRRYEWPEAEQRTITGKTDRNLCEYDAAAVLAGIEQRRISRVVLPWIVLMKGGGEDVIMARWQAVAAAEPDEKRRGDHGGLALVFAELTPHAAAWKQALKGWNVIQSPQILEWQAQARDEGRDEGRKEGVREGRKDAIIDLLSLRFGNCPAELGAAIRAQTDPDRLKQWFTHAAQVSSLEAFRQQAGITP
jgi:hypothetical protein